MSSKPQKKYDLRDTKRILVGWPGKIGYDDSDEKVAAFYAKLSGTTTSKTSMFAKKKLVDIFIYAMALGKHAGIKQDYKKRSDRKDSIDVEYFASQPEYVWMMISTALEETDGDITIFEKPEKIVEICEQYANYGIKLLIEMENKITTRDPYIGYEEKFEELLKNLKDK